MSAVVITGSAGLIGSEAWKRDRDRPTRIDLRATLEQMLPQQVTR